jgi:hypothetical protein
VLTRTICVPMLMAASSAAWAQAAPAVGLFLNFDHRPSPIFVKAMERELTKILLPAHLRLRWFMPNESSGAEKWLGKMTLQFHGSCAAIPFETDIAAGKHPYSSLIPLADTPIEAGAILPYSETNCDRVRAFISTEEPASPGEETRLGIAIGRVLAHELYHFLLQTRIHSTTGIAEAVYTPKALLGRSLRFEHGELARIVSLFAAPSDGGTDQKISLRAN